MAVYTDVTDRQVQRWLKRYELEPFCSMMGIDAGIQNSNYFVETECGSYVLTIFEQYDPACVPAQIAFMRHLARRGVVCPLPVRMRDGSVVGYLGRKPAALFVRLRGASVKDVSPTQVAAVGTALASLHVAGMGYPMPPHPRGFPWVEAAARRLRRFLSEYECALIDRELDFQRGMKPVLPIGCIHADLFRDNVLFEDARITGILDFYFSGSGPLLFDLAVTVNDWCSNEDGSLDPERSIAFLAAYTERRPLVAAEQAIWPRYLCAAALRFWLSRLGDACFPPAGASLRRHDPGVFSRMLESHAANTDRNARLLSDACKESCLL